MFLRALLTAILFSFSQGNLFGQDSTRANLFPLHDGDYWEYDSHLLGIPDPFTATLRVIGDTLMPNGKTYKQIRLTDFGTDGKIFQRVDDSLNVLQGSSTGDTIIEKLLFKLDAQIGEKWFPFFPDTSTISQVTDIYEVEAFSRERKVMEIHEEPLVNFFDYTLMEGIGMVFWAGEGFFWSFRGAIIDGTQYGTITSVNQPKEEIPRLFELLQNYPNPFNAETTIRYRLAEPSNIKITVYDVWGRDVIKLVDEEKLHAGDYFISWNGQNQKGGEVASGLYFYQLRAGIFVETKRALLIK